MLTKRITQDELVPGLYYRKCQECNHYQKAKPPADPNMSDAYRHAKCKACGSSSLDYGTVHVDDEDDWSE